MECVNIFLGNVVVRKPVKARNQISRNQGNHGVERKNRDVSLAQAFDTTGTITLLNGITQGSDIINRVGNRIDVVSILIRGSVAVGATPTSATYRWLVVYDKQANAATPLITDVLTAISLSGVNNLANRDRFVIYLDKTGQLEATDKTTEPIKEYIECNLETTYNGTGATSAAIATGALYFISVGNLAAGVTTPTVAATSRIRYIDS